MAVYNPAAVQPLQGLPADAESCPGMIDPISFEAKQTGERNARKWHVAFDAAEAGNVAWSRWCDTRRRKSESTGNTNFDLNRHASLRPYRVGSLVGGSCHCHARDDGSFPMFPFFVS